MKDREYLLHVQKAISEIAEHTAGLSREDVFGVDRSIVWDVLLEDLPRLRTVVGGMLARERVGAVR